MLDILDSTTEKLIILNVAIVLMLHCKALQMNASGDPQSSILYSFLTIDMNLQALQGLPSTFEKSYTVF
jgi:hypothetical protein